MIEEFDITPHTNLLTSIRSEKIFYHVLCAEGVDNSFDAGATQVVITLQKNFVEIQDDGMGITRDKQSAILKLGEHASMVTTALGRFGIGIKYQAIIAGDQLEVASISKDGKMALRVNWLQILKQDRWKVMPPTWTTAVRSAPTGTTLTVANLRKHPIEDDIRRAAEKLAQIFYPALISGRTITLNDNRIPVLAEPEMSDIVEGDIQFENGKSARIRGGICLKYGSLYQVQVSYKHRVIMPQSAFGCGAYGGLRRMFARIDLSGPWGLRRFKDGLDDNDEDELQDRVEVILRPVLEKCNSAQLNLKIDRMTEILNEMLPPDIVPARPPKKKKPKKPIRPPKPHEPNRLTKEGEENEKGPARKRSTKDQLIIDFDEPLVDEYGYGDFIAGKPGRIVLAADNPHIKVLISQRDEQTAAQTIYAFAIMIYLQARDVGETPGGQMQVDLNGDGSFGRRVWKMVSFQNGDTKETIKEKNQ